MEMKFLNDTGSAVWLVYYGLDPAENRKPVHLADRTGRLAPNEPTTEPTDTLAVPVTGNEPFILPMLRAARLYISEGKPLRLLVDRDGNPLPPMSADPKDPNYGTPWDFFEATHALENGKELFNFNLSNVQSANLSLRFHVAGSDPSSGQQVDYTRGWVAGGYAAFLKSMLANTDFKGLVLPGTNRVLAPGTAITALKQGVIQQPLFATDYLETYIEKVWEKFETTDLTFVADPLADSAAFVNWTGRVASGKFRFTPDQPNLHPIVLNLPTTADLLENNFTFCGGGCGEPGTPQQSQALQLFGTLCAAFNRSVMLTTTTLANAPSCAWCKETEKFYRDPTTNHYSKDVHANSFEEFAYAFQSDDHCDVSSYVAVSNPGPLTITMDART